MGSSQTSTSGGSQQSSTTTPKPTAEETELNRLQLEREKFLDPQIRETQSSGLSLANQLLRGEEDLPGFLSTIPGGISPEITSSIVQESLRDIRPSFQQSGLLDSGVRASIEARTAGDIRRASEEFNIGARQNLLNLALSGQAQVQNPILGFSGQLGSRLAGLRTVTQTGSSSFNQQTVQRPNTTSQLLGIGTAIGGAAILACWVAGEIFGGMMMPKTRMARIYMLFKAPDWLLKLYMKHGKRFAAWIKDKPVVKAVLKPIFEWFADQGRRHLYGTR